MVRDAAAAGSPLVDLANSVSLRRWQARPRRRRLCRLSPRQGAVYNKYAAGAQLERQYKRRGPVLAPSARSAWRSGRKPGRPANPHRADLLQKLENVRTLPEQLRVGGPGRGRLPDPGDHAVASCSQLALEESIVRSPGDRHPDEHAAGADPDRGRHQPRRPACSAASLLLGGRGQLTAESQASFGKVVLDAKKLVGFFKVPNELLADAPAFSSWFDTRIPAGLAWSEDVAFMTETGAGTPEGFIGSPGLRRRSTATTMQHDHLGGHRDDVRPDAAAVAEERGVDRVASTRSRQLAQLSLSHAGHLDGRLGRAATPPTPRRSASWAARCSSPRRSRRCYSGGSPATSRFVDLSLLPDRRPAGRRGERVRARRSSRTTRPRTASSSALTGARGSRRR